MTKVKFTPKDKDWKYNCAEFSARNGDVVEVSDVKVRQLFGDFPGQWVAVGDVPIAPPAPPVPAPSPVMGIGKPKR